MEDYEKYGKSVPTKSWCEIHGTECFFETECVECPACDGHGELGDYNPDEPYEPCPECEGEGRIPDDD